MGDAWYVDVIGSAPEAGEDAGRGVDGERSGRRFWRPRILATVAVLAAAFAWPIAARVSGPAEGRTSATPPQLDLSMAIGTVLGEPRSDWPVRQVVIADATHWYALVIACSGAGRCTEQLSASSDGGSSWRRHHLPGSPEPDDGDLRVLGPGSLLLSFRDARWVSPDSGLHWRPAEPAKSSPAESVPEDGEPTLVCAAGRDGVACPDYVIAATDPQTGADAPLRHQPLLGYPAVSAARPGDGSIWVSGIDRLGRPAVAVSRDRGRSWTTSPLPRLTGRPPLVRLLTNDGRRAYALIAIDQPVAQHLNGLERIARSDDGGRSWRIVRTADGTAPGTALAAVLLASGRLMVSVEPPEVGLFLSGDGGRSFHLQQDAPSGLSWLGTAGGDLLGEGGGYLWRMDSGGRWHLLKP